MLHRTELQTIQKTLKKFNSLSTDVPKPESTQAPVGPAEAGWRQNLPSGVQEKPSLQAAERGRATGGLF